ncbi:MAG: glycosyltransferase [Rubrivivax sp.]|nr:glycosyltransferase [Rubrivivax sp.]
MDVSVAICTYNRVAMLQDTLASFAAQHGRCRARFELLVVDNNSSDGTAAAVAAFAGEHPHVPTRCIREPRQGLSHARNRAAREAAGAVVVFCDDDVYFDTNVVDAYADAFRGDAGLAAAAGRIDAHFEAPRPAWLSDALLAPYSITAFGDASRPLAADEQPVGANMAVRRELVLALGGFNPKLGRDGKSLLSNEENLFFGQLRRQGGAFAYLPAARVRHRISPERLTEQWLVSRYFWQGISDAVLEVETGRLSRAAALGGAWGDIVKVLGMLRPRNADLRAWYWHVRHPGVAVAHRRAYRWGRAKGRLRTALFAGAGSAVR